MSVKKKGSAEQLVARINSTLLADFTPDLTEACTLGADEIVRTTLAGIGTNDLAFKPYSKSYQEQIDAVGGKPSGVVDLRGIFYKRGAEPKKITKTLLKKGGGRRAYLFLTLGGRQILVRTRLTRPRVGVVDRLSEMSRDLITVRATERRALITYTPRSVNYMIGHNDTRVWFSLNKSAVRGAILQTLKTMFAARVDAFNSGA